MTTPDFPAWAGAFAAHLKRLGPTLGPTLHQFEALFAAWVPSWRLAQQDEGAHSRDRHWNLRLTFWTFLWQLAQAGASCREAIRQAQSWRRNSGRRPPPDQNSAHCQARYAHPVLIVETFVDPDQFCGTVYRANGWEELGLTDGCGRHRRDIYVNHDKPKRLFCRQLCPNARRR
jgi:hypothetical protein